MWCHYPCSESYLEEIVNLSPIPEPIHANLQSHIEGFKAADQYVRSYAKQWVTVAQVCLRIKQAGSWKGETNQKTGLPYTSWEDWVTDAGGPSARTIFYHTGVIKDLSPDFTAEELAEMKPETAKVMRVLDKTARADPRVRSAASGKRKRDFVKVVQETHPEQLVEQENDVLLHLEQSVFLMWRETIDGMRLLEDDLAMSHETVMEHLLGEWLEYHRGMIAEAK
jgi:hypothetical protein